jgi:hypothetical protein
MSPEVLMRTCVFFVMALAACSAQNRSGAALWTRRERLRGRGGRPRLLGWDERWARDRGWWEAGGRAERRSAAVRNTDATLYQLDPEHIDGPMTVGTLGTDPKTKLPWALSGDIVFLANSGSPIGFATVRTCPAKGGCSTVDTLIEVDVKAIKARTQSVLKSSRGPVTRGAWCKNTSSPTTFGGMLGIVAFKDAAYGFSRQGDVVEIHNTDGSGCLVPSDPSRKFAGAGSTTTAPVIAPPVS